MNFVRLVPVILSSLLLGAHFSRHGMTYLVVPAVLFPAILFVKKPWVARLTQVVLILGGIEWLRTLVVLVSTRSEAGEPWTRLAVILGAVTAFTFASVLPFFLSATIRSRYGLEEGE